MHSLIFIVLVLSLGSARFEMLDDLIVERPQKIDFQALSRPSFGFPGNRPDRADEEIDRRTVSYGFAVSGDVAAGFCQAQDGNGMMVFLIVEQLPGNLHFQTSPATHFAPAPGPVFHGPVTHAS